MYDKVKLFLIVCVSVHQILITTEPIIFTENKEYLKSIDTYLFLILSNKHNKFSNKPFFKFDVDIYDLINM